MLGQYNVLNLAAECARNADYLKSCMGKSDVKRSDEGFTTDMTTPTGLKADEKKIMGMCPATFMLLTIISLIVYVWALVALINHWSKLKQTTQVVAILGLVTPVGPFVTLLAIFYDLKMQGKKSVKK